MKFEYVFFSIFNGKDEELKKLNELGDEGWEVVVPISGSATIILKRVKK